MSDTGRERFIADMVSWLNRRFASSAKTIARDTPLFESRLIDSIRILELIAWTERAIGRRIPDASIRLDNFRTVERVAETFLGAETHVGR